MVLQVEPRPDAILASTDAELRTDPPVAMRRFIDVYGNVGARLTLGPGRTRIRYQALVEGDAGAHAAAPPAAQAAVADLPDDTLHFTLASRYCESDTLSNTAWALFGDTPPGWSRAQAVVDWVHQNITFSHGRSTTDTTDQHL